MISKKYLLLAIILFFMSLVFVKGYAKDHILRAGIAKVDITPSESVYLEGYDESCREDPSDGVFAKIYVRALVFDDNAQKIVLIENLNLSIDS